MISVIIISAVFCGLFYGIKTAYTESDRMMLELEKNKHTKLSRFIIFLTDHPKQLLITLIIGNIISFTIYGYSIIKTANLSLPANPNISKLIICTIGSWIIILITSYFIPRLIFSRYPNLLFNTFSPFTLFFYFLFYPITLFFIYINKLFSYQKKQNIEDPSTLLKDNLSSLIDEKFGESKDKEIDSEIQYFKNALKFSDLRARDCMIYRKEITAVDIEESIQNLAQKFTVSGFSKIIVYRNTIDNVIGYVHNFDLLKKPQSIKHILFPIEKVHETTPVKDIMNRMMKKSRTISIVLDEYGGTAGLLTLEDIVEELLGNIEDEHDKQTETEQMLGVNHFLFSSKLKTEYLNQKYNLAIPESEEYSTLGGFITHLIEKIPVKGEEIIYKNKKFIINKVSESRIEEIEIFVKTDE